jgi:hypothetical protein
MKAANWSQPLNEEHDMKIHRLMTGAALTALIGFAAHSEAGVLGGGMSGVGGLSGFGGGLSGAGSFATQGQLTRPQSGSVPAGTAVRGATDKAKDTAKDTANKVQSSDAVQTAETNSAQATAGKSTQSVSSTAAASATKPAAQQPAASSVSANTAGTMSAAQHSATVGGSLDAEHAQGTSSASAAGGASLQ